MDIDDDFSPLPSPVRSSPEPQKKFKRLKKRGNPSPPARRIEEDAAAKALNAILNEDDSIDAADEALDAILNEDDSIDAADKTLDAILNEDDSIDPADETLDAILNEDDSIDAAEETLDAILNEDDSIDAADKTLDAILNEDDDDDDSNHAADATLDAILNEDDDSNDAADKTLNAILNEDTNDSFPARLESLLDTDDSNGPAEMLPVAGGRKVTKRALDFSDVADSDTVGDSGRTETKHGSEEEENEGGEKEDSGSKKKNKRIKSDEKKSKPPAQDKRRQEKERKEHLKQLHAESQRLLRETTEAAFKPIPAVKKPISSVLEKIRQRKLELSKRKAPLYGNASVTESSVNLEDDMVGPESSTKLTEPKKSRKTKPLEEVFHGYPETYIGKSVVDELSEPTVLSSNDDVILEKKSPSEPVPMFRAPINDTEDIFANSETQDGIEELPGDLQDSPSDGVREPSTLSMNLKIDSDPDEDSSSEEEDDKENMDPHLHRGGHDLTSLRGAPAEAFLDNEAEEEEDSDDESLGLNKTEEEEDVEELEELNDIIATNYSEQPVDHERRNELHQKWLEQQDAAGTDNLLHKFKIASTSNDDDIEFVEEREVSEDEENYQEEDVGLKMSAREISDRAQEMIVQMFVEKKDDGFISDEDEEIEKLRVKQQLLIRAEEQATLISPMEDESSREMFGRIKKLNIAPENKKKAKPTSFFDSILKGGNSNSVSKPSFIRPTSNQHVPSSRKKGLGAVKSFIFGRDDSNSRSSISISEDSLDAIPKEKQTTTTRTSTAMFSGSQAKFSSQYKSTAIAKASGASLFEILKRSSTPSTKPGKDRVDVDLTNVLNTFKVPKKQIKVVGRS